MSFTFKLRKAPTTICSLTLVGATLAPSTPVFAETQQPQTTDSQGQPAVVAQEDLSTLNQVEGNATPQTVSPQKRFIDVPESSAFYNEITWLFNRKITTGWSDGTFRPHDLVDRNAMAAFFYRFAGSPQFEAPEVSPFWDLSPDEPFYKEIAWLRSTDITTGWSDGSFHPYEPISREAMAAFIYRYAHMKR